MRALDVEAAKSRLAVNQRVAHDKVVGQPHHGYVGRAVAVRMVFTQNLAHHPRRFHMLGASSQAHFLHGVQDASLHRLLPVGNLRQGPALDHAHGVFQIGALGVGIQRQGIVAPGCWGG